MAILKFKGTKISGLVAKAIHLLITDTKGVISEPQSEVSTQDLVDGIVDKIDDISDRVGTNEDDITQLKKVSYHLDGTILTINIPEEYTE